VLLPGFQKGRDIQASEGNGQRTVLAKKGNLKTLKMRKTYNFTPFRVNKMFFLKFDTFTTL
jgi:hypothetical protein